jgi:hypothetical protein
VNGLDAWLHSGTDRMLADQERANRDAEALLDKVYNLSGASLYRLHDWVIGEEKAADRLVEEMHDWDAERILEAAKRAGVSL